MGFWIHNLRMIIIISFMILFDFLLIIVVPEIIADFPQGLSRTLLSLIPVYFGIGMIFIIYGLNQILKAEENE